MKKDTEPVQTKNRPEKESGYGKPRQHMAEVVGDLLTNKAYPVEQQVEILRNHLPESLSPQELAGCVDGVVGTAAYRIDTAKHQRPLVVPAGTGGDGNSTVNITTMAGVVMAASEDCEVPLYGNRSASGRFGKMDVLEGLGVDINASPEEIEKRLKETGIAAVNARNVYPGAGRVAEARRQMGKPTLFNSAMPLAAPIEGDRRMLLGVASSAQLKTMADIAQARGTTRSVFVRNRDHGADEFLPGVNDVEVVRGNKRERVEVDTAHLGISPCSIVALQANSPEEFVGLFEDTLNPSINTPQIEQIRQVVGLNAAAGLYVAENGTESLDEALPRLYGKAREIMQSGAAQRKLRQMQGRTQ